MLTLVDRLIDGVRGSALPIAVMELRSTLTRATALAATGALALFGTVAIQGAHRDLLRGLDVTAAAMLDTTDVWVTAAGDENILMTTPFAEPNRKALIDAPEVASVRAYRGEFLDMAGRRVWVMARPPQDDPIISPTDIQEGDAASAMRRVRGGGWAALSDSIARRAARRRRRPVTIPTPTGPQALRVAAIVSNLGWAPGSLVLNGERLPPLVARQQRHGARGRSSSRASRLPPARPRSTRAAGRLAAARRDAGRAQGARSDGSSARA